MSTPIIAAAAAFLASLGLALWLARTHRERLGFAGLVASPVVAALAFVAVQTLRQAAPAGAATAAGPASAPAPAATPAPAAAPADASPGTGADALRHEAEELRRAKRFAEARAAYARLVQAVPDDVDAWADFGDASAAAAGGDLKAGAEAIDRALAIDPNHLKALWLKASLELQERHFASAEKLWERLLAQLPPDSNDARIVHANLEETRALASQQGGPR